jgi:uncharacterized membrane protein
MEKWVIYIIWIGILIIPIALIVTGLILWQKTPKLNKVFGYRTSKTLSNEETWTTANKFWGMLSFIIGIIDLIILIPTLILTIPDKYWISLVVFGVVAIASFVVPIVLVERKLKTV